MLTMRAPALLYLLLIAAAWIGPVTTLIQTGTAKKLPQFSNRIIKTGAVSVADNVTSGLECIMVCLKLQTCVSVFYRQLSRKCQVHDVLFLAPEDGAKETGTSYYQLRTGSCPPDYIHARVVGLCYQLHLKYKEQDLAAADCATRKEHLIVIDNQEKQDHVAKQVTSSSVTVNSYFIDGSDAETEGQWMYHDGRPVTFFAWDNGYPSNFKPFDYLAAFANGSTFLWHDRTRTTKRFFICEKCKS